MRLATAVLVLSLNMIQAAPVAAEPPAPAPPAPASEAAVAPSPEAAVAPKVATPNTGEVASGPPGVAETPEGTTLTVAAADETQMPVLPLTTALSSRDWLVGGTFTGATSGPVSGGSLVVGYQIGCGVEMNQIRLGGTVGGGLSASGVTAPIQGAIDVRMRPGQVINAEVIRQDFSGDSARVIVKDIHVHVDACVGQSSLRSYAVLTSSTPNTEDIVAYYGVTKVF